MSHFGQSKGNYINRFHSDNLILEMNAFMPHIYLAQISMKLKANTSFASASANKQNMQMDLMAFPVNLFHSLFGLFQKKKNDMNENKYSRKEAKNICVIIMLCKCFSFRPFGLFFLISFFAFVCRNMFVIFNATEPNHVETDAKPIA